MREKGLRQGERTDRAQDQVKGVLVAVCSLGHGNIVVRAQLLGIFLLVPTPRDGRHLGTHSLGQQDPVMSQAPNSHHTNSLSGRAGTPSFKRRIHGDTTAEHGRSAGEIHSFGDRNGKPGGTTPVVCESALGKGFGGAGFAAEVGLVSYA